MGSGRVRLCVSDRRHSKYNTRHYSTCIDTRELCVIIPPVPGIRDIPWAVELYTVQLVTIRSSLQVTVEPLQPVRCDKAWGKGGRGGEGSAVTLHLKANGGTND